MPDKHEQVAVNEARAQSADAKGSGVSVVIPNYNHSAELDRAVTCFARQSLPPKEIIVVDDASTDDSVAVATALARQYPNVVLIRRDRRGGPNAAVNTGLASATGTYVMFAAADDTVEPELFQRAVDLLVAYPQAAICFHDPSAVDTESRQLSPIPLYLAAGPSYFGPSDVESLFKYNSFSIPSNTVVYRREHITAIGGFRVDLEWQSDWMANLVLAFRYGACYRPETLAHFTVNPRGYGATGVRSAKGQRRMLFACLDALENDFADVRESFRRARLLPELRLRVLFWLLVDPRGRDYLTWPIARRLLARELWTLLRPLAPAALRRWMRRTVGEANHGRLGKTK